MEKPMNNTIKTTLDALSDDYLYTAKLATETLDSFPELDEETKQLLNEVIETNSKTQSLIDRAKKAVEQDTK